MYPGSVSAAFWTTHKSAAANQAVCMQSQHSVGASRGKTKPSLNAANYPQLICRLNQLNTFQLHQNSSSVCRSRGLFTVVQKHPLLSSQISSNLENADLPLLFKAMSRSMYLEHAGREHAFEFRR